MFIQILILLSALIALIVGADQLVKGSSSVAKRFGVSNLFIGLTVVAFGSSMPEMIVDVFAAANGSVEMALGNITGSNIANVLLVLGAAALVRPLIVERVSVWREIPFAILAAAMLFVFTADVYLGESINVISRSEGIALLGFFAIFIYFTFLSALQHRAKDEKNVQPVIKYSKIHAAFMIVGGLISLIIGGAVVVRSATSIALALGVSEALISVTIVAVGTSLPELTASVVAAFKGHTEMAIGNVVGSVIFNTLWVLGLSSVIHPLTLSSGGLFEVSMMFGAVFLLFPFMVNGKRVGELTRVEGGIFLSLYALFIAFTIWRG